MTRPGRWPRAPPYVGEEVGAPLGVAYDASVGLSHALGDAELGAVGVVPAVSETAAHNRILRPVLST